MGVDALLYVKDLHPETDIGDRHLLKAAEILWEARKLPFVTQFPDRTGNQEPIFQNGSYWGESDDSMYGPTSLCRYYGPGYERGDWPEIYAAIRMMKKSFPGKKVYYHGDNHDFHPRYECTPEYLDAIWDHYLGSHYNDYRKN